MDWEPTKKRFLGFFDIMGFENYVYRNNHRNVKNRMEKLNKAIDTIDKKPFIRDSIEHTVRFYLFSDSILLISDDDSDTAASMIIAYSNWLLIKCFKEAIPIKGAISYGNITADFEQSLFFGKALIDAYRLQEQLFMYGGVVDDKFQVKLKKIKGAAEKVECKNQLYFGKIPFKGGGINHFALNWYNYWRDYRIKDPDFYNSVINTLSEFYLGVSGNTRKYVDNTVSFVENIIKTNNHPPQN